jgi:hypothetical protein
MTWALGPAFLVPGAKARDQDRTFSRSADALLPRINAGAPTQRLPRLLDSPPAPEPAWHV